MKQTGFLLEKVRDFGSFWDFLKGLISFECCSELLNPLVHPANLSLVLSFNPFHHPILFLIELQSHSLEKRFCLESVLDPLVLKIYSCFLGLVEGDGDLGLDGTVVGWFVVGEGGVGGGGDERGG